MSRVLALLGRGVERRSDLLRKHLDNRWETIVHGTGKEGEKVRSATAAIGMTDAVHWKNEIPALRFLQIPGAGLDGLNMKNLPKGCVVCNVHEHEGSITEYVFACLVYFNRGWIEQAQADLRNGKWPFFDRIGQPCRPSMCGRKIGILGFGRIAQRCARVALSLNMEVLVHTRTLPSPADLADRWGTIRFVSSIQELAMNVDYFLVACLLKEETEGIVDRAILEVMQSHTILINVSRAHIVNERALYESLRNRRIGGAILDVWYRYPFSESDEITGSELPFHLLDNVLVTPHLAANTKDMVERRWKCMADNLNRFLEGRPLINQVFVANG